MYNNLSTSSQSELDLDIGKPGSPGHQVRGAPAPHTQKLIYTANHQICTSKSFWPLC